MVELDWTAFRDYNSLFNTMAQQPMGEMFRDANSSSSNTFETVVNECSVKFTPANDFRDFWLLRHPALFNKLDQACDIIHIVGSSYFAPFLMDPSVHGDKGNQMRSVFTDNAFATISKCHVQPKQQLQAASSLIISDMKSAGDLMCDCVRL